MGESYPFCSGSRFVLTSDNHNSVNGIREFARAAGATVTYVPGATPSLRVDEELLEWRLRSDRTHANLFAYPAQSNSPGSSTRSSGFRARAAGWAVLVDCAAFVPTNRLDLSEWQPDFVPVSLYKLLGYPTGVGCLVARREALAGLRRPWFAGGTIATVSVQGDWHTLADGEARFEDGTLNYLALPAVEQRLALVEGIGIGTIHTRVRCLTEWLLDELGALRHANGRAAVQLYGPRTTDRRGGTITFNLVWPDGRLVDIRIVERRPPLAGSRSGRGASATRARRRTRLRDPLSRTCAGRRAPKGPTSTCAPSASRAAARSVSRLGPVTTFADVYRFMRFVAGFAA